MLKTVNTSFTNYSDSSPGGPFCQTDNATLTVFRQDSLSSDSKSNVDPAGSLSGYLKEAGGAAK